MKLAPEVLAAIAKVSFTIPCLDCYATISVVYSEVRELIVIRHDDPNCICVVRPYGIEAASLVDFVLDELGRYCVIAQYNSDLPMPVNIGAGA